MYIYIYMFFPNSFSYGLWGLCQYRLRGGSGAASGGQVPGGSGNHGFGKVRRFRGRFRTTFRTTASRKFGGVPGQVLNDRFRAGSEPRVSGQVSGDRVPPGRFQNGSGQVSRL